MNEQIKRLLMDVVLMGNQDTHLKEQALYILMHTDHSIPDEPSEVAREAAKQFMRYGKKLLAIKMLRLDRNPLGLKEAKEYVERHFNHEYNLDAHNF